MKTSFNITKHENGSHYILTRKGDGPAGHPLTSLRLSSFEDVLELQDTLEHFVHAVAENNRHREKP
jgi:hypothetical protein